MHELNIIEVRGVRLLTTKQLAEAYEADVKTVQYNFRYNKTRYIPGKHYIEVTGDELKKLKTRNEFQSQFKYAKSLYLWTEKGALLHAKSLNTDKAWEVYDYLVDYYFRAKETAIKPQSFPAVNTPVTSKSTVIDIPENPKAQKLIQDIKKHLATLDVLVDGSNQYQSKGRHDNYCRTILNVQMQLINVITEYAELTPKLIEKA